MINSPRAAFDRRPNGGKEGREEKVEFEFEIEFEQGIEDWRENEGI